MTATVERREFGSVFALPNGRFQARYRLNGRAFKQTFNTHRAAEKHLDRTAAELDLGTHTPPTVRRTTFEEAETLIIGDFKMNNRKSLDRLEDAIEHLRPTFGGMRLAAITADRIVVYITDRQAAGAANATIQKEVACLRRMFRLCVAARRLMPGQVPTFPRLRLDNARTGFVSVGEFRALRAHLDDDVGPMIEFMFVTGWRKSEAQGLVWGRVDWEGGVVRLDVGTTKSGAARLFPFSAFPDLEALLRRQRERTDAVQRRRGMVATYVFHREGAPIRDFRDHWQQACRRAGLVNLIPHDLRRAAVRNLVRAGVPEHTAMALSGHKTRAIFDRYNIVDEADLADGVARLAQYTAAQAQKVERRVVPMKEATA